MRRTASPRGTVERINDDYGHEVGDAVLFAIGQVLSEQDQAHCFAARHGG
ncbi:diguanylate cyclase, partial [Xanthomonas vasicola]